MSLLPFPQCHDKQLVINRFKLSWIVKDFNTTVTGYENGNFLKSTLITFLKLSNKDKESTYVSPLLLY